MKSTVIYSDDEVQIVGYDNDNEQRGDTFGLYENGIDIEKGGQRELLHMRIDRGFWGCIEEVKPILLNAVKSYRYLIRRRKKEGKVVPL